MLNTPYPHFQNNPLWTILYHDSLCCITDQVSLENVTYFPRYWNNALLKNYKISICVWYAILQPTGKLSSFVKKKYYHSKIDNKVQVENSLWKIIPVWQIHHVLIVSLGIMSHFYEPKPQRGVACIWPFLNNPTQKRIYEV